ncbi:phytoene desaturase family protein [Isoptericola sp. NPDC057191]|uniref:phytoene desaturase family protein n=1 Tax=Isoptericola sp. NPDC057191 TaxID=3346041 RepID=UPI0036310607
MSVQSPDVTVVGSGPNGLAAAYVAATHGLSVRVVEQSDRLGGGLRSEEVVEPGFSSDVCAAVHPLAVASPFFAATGLLDDVELVTPEISYAQTLHRGRAAVAYHDVGRTADALGRDGATWRRIFDPLVADVEALTRFTLGAPLGMGLPGRPHVQFGLRALATARLTGPTVFRGIDAPGLLSGLHGHTMGDAGTLAGSFVGLTLGVHAHAGGWPIPVGGSGAIAAAMIARLQDLGVELVTGHRVRSLAETAGSRAVLLDVAPQALPALAGGRLSPRAARPYQRFLSGSGAAKLDLTLDGPVPWTDERLAGAGTVHLGGRAAELVSAERAAARGLPSRSPFMLVAQPSTFDPTRAPEGKHVLWCYAHVPRGDTRDISERMIDAIELHAPGFRDLVRGGVFRPAAQLEDHNPNMIGGDIGTGGTGLRQLFARPRFSPAPWVTPLQGTYLCSAGTSPGPGVHGMAGWHAARHALRREFGITVGELH